MYADKKNVLPTNKARTEVNPGGLLWWLRTPTGLSVVTCVCFASHVDYKHRWCREQTGFEVSVEAEWISLC